MYDEDFGKLRFTISITEHNRFSESKTTYLQPIDWYELEEVIPALIKPSMFGNENFTVNIKVERKSVLK